MRVEAMGLTWRMSAPDVSLAADLTRLGSAGEAGGDIIVGLLAGAMDAGEFGRLMRVEGMPADYVMEVFFCWLETWSGKPVSAVAGLCNILVENWGRVRGKLVLAGIPDPMREVPLLALLDAVEVMVRETHRDEKEGERFTRELYRPRVKKGAGKTKHPGFSRAEMEAQAAALEAMAG